MYIATADTDDIKFVIDNLSEITVNELKKLFGNDYKTQVFSKVTENKNFAIKLKSTNKVVGLFGIIKVNNYAGGIFLLTTDYLHNGNIITFLRQAKKQIQNWEKEYKLLMDTCDKKNITIQKWLQLLGFMPSAYQDNNFQIWYKGDLKYYD